MDYGRLVVSGGQTEDFEGSRVGRIPKGGQRFFNVIRGGGEVGKVSVHNSLKIIYSLSVFQFCHIHSIGDLLPLGPSLRLNMEVEFGDDEVVIRPAVSVAHRLCHPRIPSVSCPDNGVVKKMSMLRSRVHLRRIVRGR